MTVMLFSSNAYASTPVDQVLPDAEKKVIYSKILNLVLEGKEDQIKDLDLVKNLNNRFKDNPELKKQIILSSCVFNKKEKPVRIIKNISTSGVRKDVLVYSDNSFATVSYIVKKKDDEKYTSPLGDNYFWSETFSGYGSWWVQVWYKTWDIFGIVNTYWQLKADFYNYDDHIGIYSVSPAGSYAVWPFILANTTTSIPQNNQATAIAQADYTVNITNSSVPIASYIDTLKIILEKPYNGPDFTATGVYSH